MERLGYTRLYATVTGTLLVLLGLFGFLVNSQFKTPFLTNDLLGVLAINGWANCLHIVIGLIALVMARRFSRFYAVLAGIGLSALGLWGILAPDGHLLAGKLPAGRTANLLNLALGLLGLLAIAATYGEDIIGNLRQRRERRRKKRDARRRRRRIRRSGKRGSGKRRRPSTTAATTTARSTVAPTPSATAPQMPVRPRKPSVRDRTRDDG